MKLLQKTLLTVSSVALTVGLGSVSHGYNASYDCSNATDASQTECEALLQLATRSSVPATDFANRGDSNTVCSRQDVTCVGNNVRDLDLYEKQISSIDSGDFSGLSNLAEIRVGGSGLITLGTGVFDSLTGLGKLTIHSSSITSLPEGVFDNNTDLYTLSLYNNTDLAILNSGVFDALTTLGELTIFGSNITSLPEGIFDNNTDLESLSLFNNSNLSVLNAGVFDALTNLGELGIRGSSITSLPAGVFDNNDNLYSLDIIDNANLAVLNTGVFDALGSLEELYLNGNDSLTELPAGLLNNHSSIYSLSLANNSNLTTIPSSLVANMGSLEELYLNGNDSLTELPDLGSLLGNDGEVYLADSPITDFGNFSWKQWQSSWSDLIYGFDFSGFMGLLFTQPLFNDVQSTPTVSLGDTVKVTLSYNNLNDSSSEAAGMLSYIGLWDYDSVNSNDSGNIEFYVKAFDDVKVDNEIVINVQ